MLEIQTIFLIFVYAYMPMYVCIVWLWRERMLLSVATGVPWLVHQARFPHRQMTGDEGGNYLHSELANC